MQRAWKRSVAFLVVGGATAWASSARAFHAGNLFDKPAGAGGGGGIFYTGAASERGWDCNSCHTSAAHSIRVTLAAEPPALLQTFRYEPGKTYTFKATLDGEHLGAGASNFNSFAVAIVDGEGAPGGDFSGYAADEFYSSRTTLVSAGQQPGENRWSFRWTAPTTPGTRVKLHIAAVDGNGADGAGGGTLTDPWGDDVFVGALTFDASATGERANEHDVRMAMLGMVCLVGLRRRRGGDPS